MAAQEGSSTAASSHEALAVRIKTERTTSTPKSEPPKTQAHGSRVVRRTDESASRSVPCPSASKLPPVPESQPPEPPSIDEPSIRGAFGWATIGGVHLPYILRGEEKFVAARMMECKLIYKYLGVLPWSIFSCTNIKSYYITENEAKLLNEINGFHCEYQFGYEPFVVHDVVVPLKDAVKLYEFLETCQRYLGTPDGFAGEDKCCGYVLVCGSPVPYVQRDKSKYVPVELVQNSVMLVQVKQRELEEWDAAYLRFLCVVIGQDPSRIKVGGALCSADELKWDARLCPLHVVEWKPSFQTPLLKKIAGQSIYSAFNSGYLFGSGGTDWNSVSKFPSQQDFDALYNAKKGLHAGPETHSEGGGPDCKIQKIAHNASEKDHDATAVSGGGSKNHGATNCTATDLSKTANVPDSVNKSLHRATHHSDSSNFLKPTGPPASGSFPTGAFVPPSLMFAEAALKSNLLPGPQQLCNPGSTSTLTALMQDPLFLQWYSSALMTGTLGLSSLMPPASDRDTLANAMYSFHGMQNYASSASPSKLPSASNPTLASFLSATPSPQYPTPPQSCPLSMHLPNSSMFPGGSVPPNDMTRLAGKVDFCSPPPTPEGLSVLGLNPQAHQEDVYITPDDHGSDRGSRRSECTAQETVVDGHLMTAAVDSHQAMRCSVLVADLTRILPGLSKELCTFALENLLGKTLPGCNRLQVEAFAKRGKHVSEGEKLVDVEELKLCLPQLKLLSQVGNMQMGGTSSSATEKSNEHQTNRPAGFTTTT